MCGFLTAEAAKENRHEQGGALVVGNFPSRVSFDEFKDFFSRERMAVPLLADQLWEIHAGRRIYQKSCEFTTRFFARRKDSCRRGKGKLENGKAKLENRKWKIENGKHVLTEANASKI